MSDGGAGGTREERITSLLGRLQSDEQGVVDQLFALLYDELHELAHRQRLRLAPRQTLDTTALLHEAYLKFAGKGALELADRGHFLALAATVMRHLLIDNARKADAAKRSAGLKPATLDGVADPAATPPGELLALDKALHSLQSIDGRLVRVVEMRFFGGMTAAEVAGVFGVTERTVKRDWRKAKVLLLELLASPANP